MKHAPLYLFGLIALALILVACASPAEVPAPQANEETTAQTIMSPTSQPITISDALGRSVTFDKLPTRIVVAGKATIMIADALYLFPQASERIVAITHPFQGADFLPIVDPVYEGKTILKGQTGPEQVAASKPDVVLIKSYLAETLGDPIEELGIPVVTIDLETPDEYLTELQSLGVLFGDQPRAQTIVDYYKRKMAVIQNNLFGLEDQSKPSILLMQHSVKGGETAYKVPPSTWMQTRIVEMAGGSPVWKDEFLGSGWSIVTLEQIALWNPDQIYIIDYFDDPTIAVEKFKAEPSIQGLKAISSGQVYAFPKDTYSWDQPDPRWILGATWLAKHIHPARFENVDISQEFTEFYKTLYRLDESTIREQLQPLLVGSIP